MMMTTMMCHLSVMPQGATITRWLKEDGTDLLFTRSDAVFEQGEAIK
jgi:D-hexose-6-phosphate mutarotase